MDIKKKNDYCTGTGGSGTVGTWRWCVYQPYAQAAFTHQQIFLVLTSGPQCGQKDFI